MAVIDANTLRVLRLLDDVTDYESEVCAFGIPSPRECFFDGEIENYESQGRKKIESIFGFDVYVFEFLKRA